ncbi:MAG: hypothetical protein HZB36_04560 [Candidatus Omnitrophica bacterium]|nr:hypothetical protein [Candidatus Omnitrophota bacterium]
MSIDYQCTAVALFKPTIRSFLAKVCEGLHFGCSDNLLWSVTAKMQTEADGKKLRRQTGLPQCNKDLWREETNLSKENAKSNYTPGLRAGTRAANA